MIHDTTLSPRSNRQAVQPPLDFGIRHDTNASALSSKRGVGLGATGHDLLRPKARLGGCAEQRKRYAAGPMASINRQRHLICSRTASSLASSAKRESSSSGRQMSLCFFTNANMSSSRERAPAILRCNGRCQQVSLSLNS